MTITSLRTQDIRNEFKELLAAKKFTSVNREATMTSLTGNSTIEIINASFIADEDSIFGEVNWDYVKREEKWYYTQSLNICDFPGGAPAVWKAVADKDGFINSNYGWAIFSEENGFLSSDGKIIDTHDSEYGWWNNQYDAALIELRRNPESRRAVMIYTRPSMWLDYDKNGRSDFVCTNLVQYLIRDNRLHAVVQMRSNDAIFGYKNDRTWQQHVLDKLSKDLSIDSGNLYWNVGSLHIYSRHFYLIDSSYT